MSGPRGGYAGRMRIYVREMFPAPAHLGYAALLYGAVAAFSRHVHGDPRSLWSGWTVLGVSSTFGILLILRLMDELKDRDLDERLFPDRPLPSGRLRARDVKLSLVACCAAYLGANAVSAATLCSAAIVLGFAMLMFRHFFAKRALRASLLLTLATHQPVVPLILLHAVVVSAVGQGRGLETLRWGWVGPFLLMLWMPLLGWEISRKIRSPEQETAYVTYSQVLGQPGAVAFASSVQAIAVVAGVYLAWVGVLGALDLLLVSGAYAFVLGGQIRSLRRPVPPTAGLKHSAQVFAVVVLAAQILEFGLLT